MSDIHFDTVGRAGIITLNRPKALNALSEPMILEMGEALEEWRRDDRIERVAIRAEGKAFCAGGDIRDIYERRDGAVDFFATEYRNNARVHHYPKPFVAMIDGICMGGGVGVSVHGSHRVGTENMLFAMPEVGIGLFPDVGASQILSSLEGDMGLYLALTGTRIGRDEAAALGILTHPTDADRLGDALDRTAHARNLDRALDELVVETEPADPAERAMIERAFSAPSVAEILDRLDKEDGEVVKECAQTAAAAIATKSPTSLLVTFEEIGRARDLSFDESMLMEFRILSHMLEGHDLYEGIRAAVIDKDRTPRWSPATLSGVDPEAVAAYFEEPGHGDLELPAPARRPAA